MTALAPDLSKRIAESADVVTVALDELLPRADGPESRLTEAMRYAALGPGKRLRPFFAIETGRMYLTATNTGITAAIDRNGRVLKTLKQFTEGLLEVEAQGYSGATPYVRLKDWPVVVLSLLLFAGFILRARRSR